MLLQIGPLLRLGPNGITDGSFITLGSSYYTSAFYTYVNEVWLILRHYSMWSLVRASLRCPWSATFLKMIKYLVENKNTLKNERYRDLLISILSYDEVLAFLLWVKTRN